MRLRPSIFALPLALAAVPSCTAAPEAGAVALRDPYGLIDDVVSTGHDLRLYVVPSDTYACQGDGSVTPEIPDVAAGEFADAIVDISLAADTATDTARGEARVPVGNWTVFVRGKGTDPVSGVPNSVIAIGCVTVEMLGAGETREVPLVLQPRSGMGVCGDMILSPDEQCEPPSMADCSATCQTNTTALNPSLTTGEQAGPHLAARGSFRTIGVFDSRPDVGFRMLDPNGAPITSPGALANDVSLDSVLAGMALAGEQLGGAPAIASDGRIAVPVEDYGRLAAEGVNVQMVFLTQDRTVVGAPAALRMAPAMPQRNVSAAYAGTALLAVFEDVASATGISTTFFAAGATTPSGEARPAGQAGASDPAIAGHDAGFVIAFTQGGDVFFQRFGADGSPTDAMGVAVLESSTGTQDQPVVAALANGTFAVAWREGDVGSGDGAGSSIRARIFDSSGMPRAAAFVVNSTTAGDQAAPAVAAADGRFCFVWESAGAVRARAFGENGSALLNRERPPVAADFPVGTGTAPTVVGVGSGTTGAWLFAWAEATDIRARRIPR